MGYCIYKFQNASGWEGWGPTISIDENDPGWDEAKEKWFAGKNPTDSPLWKKGVIALTKVVENQPVGG